MTNEHLQLDYKKGTIHPDTGIGYVHYTVINLERQLDFYQHVIGFKLNWREGNSAGVGVGNKDLLRLTEVPEARRYRGNTGMYHFAILLPDRQSLARVVARLFAMRYPNYPTDHVMTKSTYLDDPEGNNIEIYTESPEDGVMGVVNGQMFVQRADGTLSDGREPLDLEDLFSHVAEDSLSEVLPVETKIGHVHLYVSDLDQTLHFYHNILGMDNMGVARGFRMGMVSAGAYHHHIGFNTWQGNGAPPPPPDAAGLRWFSIELPNIDELSKVINGLREAGYQPEETDEGFFVPDPSHIGVVLTTRSGR